MQIHTIMVTDGGPHPADRWAEITSNQIVDTLLVDANPNDGSPAAVKARLAKRTLRNDLFGILLRHHDDVQRTERDALSKIKKPAESGVRVVLPIDPAPHMSTMDAVNVVCAASQFADHLAKPEVQDTIRAILGQHTVDVIHLERRWHHDRLTKGA